MTIAAARVELSVARQWPFAWHRQICHITTSLPLPMLQVSAAAIAAARAELSAREAVARSPNGMEVARQLLEDHRQQRLRQRPPIQQVGFKQESLALSAAPTSYFHDFLLSTNSSCRKEC